MNRMRADQRQFENTNLLVKKTGRIDDADIIILERKQTVRQ